MIIVRPAVAVDIEQMVEMNNAAVPAVSIADADRMATLVDLATLAWVVERPHGQDSNGADLAGFVLLFDPNSSYDSPNYRWFVSELEGFFYVDRIVVSEAARGTGIGAALYEMVFTEAARRGDQFITAEVNVVPPNPGSSRFHRRLGFDQVGLLTESDEYQVEMLARPVV